MSTAVRSRRRFLPPEVVQASALDCGPAAIKSLLGGFGIHASFGRLREACQTSIDGTSIDTIEEVACRLGLKAEQVLSPKDHLLLPEAELLPAIVIVLAANRSYHFVVLWRRVGSFVLVMDPAVGRVWMTCEQFLHKVPRQTVTMPAETFSEWAKSDDFVRVLRRRMHAIGCETACQTELQTALSYPGWKAIAMFDAAVRLTQSIIDARALRAGPDAAALLRSTCSRAWNSPNPLAVVPPNFWTARAARPSEEGAEQVEVTGALLISARTTTPPGELAERTLEPELVAALSEREAHPLSELVRLIRADGLMRFGVIGAAIVLATVGAVVEAVLLRGLFEIGRHLAVVQQRLGAALALILFVGAMLAMELPLVWTVVRTGRRLEARTRMALLDKLPRLGDRYLQSRLSADMAERSHNLHALRGMPNLAAQVARTLAESVVTTVGIILIYPRGAPIAIAALACSVALPLLSQSTLTERDLRFRTHLGGLAMFYLDALTGLVPIRSHGAERAVRRAHEELLVTWVRAALDFMRAAVAVDAAQSLIGLALAAALLFRFFSRGGDMSSIVLLAYWALNLPLLGQNFALLAREFPEMRNTMLRVAEPLGALEEPRNDLVGNQPAPANANASVSGGAPAGVSRRGVSVKFEDVTVVAGGNTILEGVNVEIPAAQSVGIVGVSGAGKSSLVGVLLGWHKAATGRVLVDGQPLAGAWEDWLRRECAWVDPTVQIWNRSLFDNLRYGVSDGGVERMSQAIDAADMFAVLERLPLGLQTPLGEGGGLVSGGEGQRVRLARALLRPDARLVILDEPFRGLDRERRRALLVRARLWWTRATLLCVTHDVSETLGFERVLVVDQGRVVEDGPPPELSADRGSRYRRMLDAEEHIRRDLWSGSHWRRFTLETGRLTEARAEIANLAEARSTMRGGRA